MTHALRILNPHPAASGEESGRCGIRWIQLPRVGVRTDFGRPICDGHVSLRTFVISTAEVGDCSCATHGAPVTNSALWLACCRLLSRTADSASDA